ncbi:MAG: hypothetical protein LBU66_01130 [Treponema sp.]|nr:hypothetical protein [Treponema sp.]
MPEVFSFLNLNKNIHEETPERTPEETFFTSLPRSGSLVFIGAAGKRSNPNETLELALLNAAERVVMFQQVSGEYVIENNIGSGAFDYTHNTHTSLNFNKDNAHQYIDSLEYDPAVDGIEIENTFFIKTTYPLSLSSPVRFRPAYSGETKRPCWVDSFPHEIDGYVAGVGFSGRHSSLATTYNNSSNNAIFSIIRTINAVSQTSDLLYHSTDSLFGYKTSSDNMTHSYGTVIGFYILDTWIEPKTGVVWTLAIAQKSN